ncbi:MAG: 3-deoxy-D-manno-octulosonic acid transferase [Nitrospira sp.]|nr:3-deoxy-D-manno-octulosonic acid transferase [bacterium]MBL7048970.1 3-deoxy-D-manno-octulosonic acid transferase [Nitrospira sp.]
MQTGARRLNEITMFLLYNLLSAIALLLYSPWIFFKKGPDDHKQFILERFGMAAYEKADIWIHAVSVGEVIAALPFLKVLKKSYPEKKLILSTTTYTGQKIAMEKFPEADRIMYMPADTWLCTRRPAAIISPEIFASVETELWPSLFCNLKNRGAKILVLNGRISENSYKGYLKIRYFMKRFFRVIDYFYMQGKEDTERIREMGAENNQVGFMGNFKFDIALPHTDRPLWIDLLPEKIILAASTHQGEDEKILEAFSLIKKDMPECGLIMVPRHPERFNQVEALITETKFSCLRKSGITNESPITDVILLDTMGELSGLFEHADIAFIGGSLVPAGGHNVLEPAYWSKPVIFGPHMENFPIAEEFIKQAAAVRITTPAGLAAVVIDLFNDKSQTSEMGQRARAIVDKNKGAINKAMTLMRKYLGTA